MSWSRWISACAVLAAACASAPRQSTDVVPSPDDVRKVGSMTIGEFLKALCDENDGQACAVLAVGLEKEGGPENLELAVKYRAKACTLGWTEACGE